MSKKVAIYIRVSTQEQAQEGFSIPAQKERLINFCKAKDWIIYDIYIDGGFSGASLSRPAVQKLMDNINNFDIVLVYKLDRLSRSQKDTLYLIEDVFIKNNVDFVSMNESFDTSTPFGRAMIGILSVFAQLERETIKERTELGRIERAKEGLYHGGGYPVGYDYIDGKLFINEYEAMQVREVFDLYLKGYGINKIINHMLQKGYKHRQGSWKHVSAILSVLDSPVYCGDITFMGETYAGIHEPIISKEIFEEVQAMRFRKRGLFAKTNDSASLLAGLIWCGNCGARYAPRVATGGNHSYYSCYSRLKKAKNLIKDETCKNDNFKRQILDDFVIKQVFSLSLTSDGLNKELQPNDNKSISIKAINSKIKSLDKQISKLLDLYQSGDLFIPDIADRIKRLHEEKESLSKELIKINNYVETLSSNSKRAMQVLPDIKANWYNMDLQEQRDSLKVLIDKIIIHDANNIDIKWSF
jgi:site-specific DNA recombinase